MTRLRQLLREQRDVLICALIVTLVACSALYRLGLLTPSAQAEQDVLVVDSARTAYVAKNLVEGNGYTTNDLPASLVAFYDREGRLHEPHWLNADRFPFAAYATAALYLVTGRTDAWTGVILYNLLTFVGFLTALYALTRRVTGSRAGGGLAVALALLHGHTYVFLYMKDADMLLLSVATIAGLQRYLARPLEARSPWAMAWLGTVIAWSFLSRPNVGAPFMVGFALVSIVGLVRASRRLGGARALTAWARADVVTGVVAAAWLAPFLIHTLAAWGSPFFSANGLYQPMLGTRFGMGTDTWWRYVPRGYDYSVGHLWREARGDVIAKFTTSWLATLRTFASAYFVELALAFGARALPRDERGLRLGAPGLGGAIALTLAVFAFNFLLLPLYAYQEYSWRHYLGFVLPVIWLCAAVALLQLGRWLAPTWAAARTWIAAHPRPLVAGAIALVVLATIRAPTNDGNLLAMGVSRFFFRHYLLVLIGLGLVLAVGWLARWRPLTRGLVAGTLALIVLYRPHLGHKRFTHIHVPLDRGVWAELRKRDGLVASFALQTQVPWNTGRRNIMAPEWVLNLYEMMRVHHLTFEDVYLESPEAQTTAYDGLHGRAAPGFEGYVRLARYRDHLPGYRVSYHHEAIAGRPRFRVAPRAKSSTVYTLTDPAALAAIYRTPTTLVLGDEASAPYAAHGFGGYYRLDGKPVIVATDVTRARYTPRIDRPHEDASVTFFVDQRVPTRVTIELSTVAARTLTFYWNLDLDDYTPARARAAHQLGEVTLASAGWHTITLDVPPGLVRPGLNKLGFRSDGFTPTALCDLATPEAVCAATSGPSPSAAVVRAETREPREVAQVAAFVHRLVFTAAGEPAP